MMRSGDHAMQAPLISLRDPLAEILGTAENGVLTYSYPDVVKAAGHSCPTVAAAFCITRLALNSLYGDQLPLRGGIRIEFSAKQSEGVTGVLGVIIGMITGAAGDGGFKGLAGHFSRRNLMKFGCNHPAIIRFVRLDTEASVDAAYDFSSLQEMPAITGLLESCLTGLASKEERKLFQDAWRDRVQKILTEHADNPKVFVVNPKGGKIFAK